MAEVCRIEKYGENLAKYNEKEYAKLACSTNATTSRRVDICSEEKNNVANNDQNKSLI